MTQQNKILELLQDNNWHCVNEFIDTYCVDYRRRLVDLKEKGYELISRKCLKHNHNGGSKEWKLLSEPPTFGQVIKQMEDDLDRKVREWNQSFDKYRKPEEITQQSLKI